MVEIVVTEEMVPVEELLKMKALPDVLGRAASQLLKRSMVRDGLDEFVTPTRKRLRGKANGDGMKIRHLLSDDAHVLKEYQHLTWQAREAGNREFSRSLSTELALPWGAVKGTSKRVWTSISDRTRTIWALKKHERDPHLP